MCISFIEVPSWRLKGHKEGKFCPQQLSGGGNLTQKRDVVFEAAISWMNKDRNGLKDIPNDTNATLDPPQGCTSVQ